MKYHGSISDAKDLITREFADHYGVCSTKNSTQAKTVTIPGLAALYEGCHITVKFTAAQTYNGVPTLNVNGLGAVNVRRDGGTNAARYEWVAGEVLHLVYDGTYWIIVDGGLATTTYYGATKLYTGAASTSDALALTPKTLNSLAINSIWGYPVYSSSSTYAVGDRVRYSVGVYECITAISTAESWTAEHWQLIPTLQAQINGKSTVVANPTLAGTETALTAVEIDGIKYKLEGGAALTLDSIYVSTPPTKTAYVYGETFDPTGMVVKARYAISGIIISEQTVTGYTYSSALTTGQTSVTISYAEDGVTKTTTQAITVAKATPTVTAPTARTLTYSGSAQNLVNSGSTTGGTLQYSLDNSTWGTSVPQGTNAGSYTVYYRVVGGTNYNDVAAQSVACSISKATGTMSLSPNSLTVDEGDTGTATITTNFDGAITASTSDSSTATASISGTTVTVSGVADGSATITLTASGGTNYTVPSSVTISVTVEAASSATIYGVEWDWTNGTSTKGTRTDAAASFSDPSPAVSSGNGSSPFDNLYPWNGMTKETRTGGVMVKEPKYYFKWTISDAGKKIKLQIADGPVEGFYCDPVNMDRGDNLGELDYSYIARYHCGTSDWKSTTGVAQKVSITRSAARTGIHGLGSYIWQMDFAQMWYVGMLYLVEFADWNGQATIGYGCSTSGSKANNGQTDSMTYHTGTTAANRTTYGYTQYRNIEGWWDNVYDWMDGCYYNSNGLNVILNPANFSDSANGTLIGSMPSSGYPNALQVSSASGYEWCVRPLTTGGSDSTCVPDSWHFSGGYPCLRHGGRYYQNQSHGPFYVGRSSASSADDNVGCRLQERPPKAA